LPGPPAGTDREELFEKTALEYAEQVVGARIRRGRDLGVAES
jgi:hypothetical protein